MAARLYIVSYDISSPKRWRGVQKAIRRLCQRGQLSVFVCRGTPTRLRALESELRSLMHPLEDRLMIVDLGPAGTAAHKLKSINLISEIAELEGKVL